MKQMTNAIEEKKVMYVEEANRVEEAVLVSKIMENKELAMSTFMQCAVNIGKHLTEAKKIVRHGEWEKWLDERVQFSARTAQNYMKIYKESEENGLDFLKTQASADLGYSQVVEILSLPKEMQKQFVEQNDLASMSAREVKKAVKEMKDENKELTVKMQSMEKDMEKEKARFKSESESKDKEIASLKSSLKQMEKDRADAEKNSDKKTAEAVDKAIKETKEKVASLEMEKDSLFKHIDLVEKKHKEEIEQIKQKTSADSKALADRKEKESADVIKKKTDAFNKQLSSLEKKLETSEKEKLVAQQQAELKEDVVRCKVLMDSIQSSYKEITQLMHSFEKVDGKLAKEVKVSFDEMLNALIERNKISEVKTGKAS